MLSGIIFEVKLYFIRNLRLFNVNNHVHKVLIKSDFNQIKLISSYVLDKVDIDR